MASEKMEYRNVEISFMEDVETNTDIGTNSDDVDEDQYLGEVCAV